MPSARFTASNRPAPSRFAHFGGLFVDEFDADSAWIREVAWLQLPPATDIREIVLHGRFRSHPAARGIESAQPSLTCRVNGLQVGALGSVQPGPFELRLSLPPATANSGPRLTLQLGGVGLTNAFAWLGRVSGFGPLQRFRAQNKNRQLRLTALTTAAGETIFDFSQHLVSYSTAFARRHTRLGMNIVGFLTADLGVGESARCMVRAADADGISAALVPLKLNCKNRLGDSTYSGRLQDSNPHPVNVIHIDAPAARDIDHHHGPAFRDGKYNVAYFAWELSEFPDLWVSAFGYFNEVWCPSDFARESIAMKSPLPVLTMPHAIAFARPDGDFRAHFGLPADQFLFLFLYDLNSYSARKNPGAVLAAFRASGLAGHGATLVIKVQNAADNPADFAVLQAGIRDLPGTVLITGTLPREEIYQLEAACDCFVSLHRSEGFGLALAECMYLGKPVISTDWSATTEFVNAGTGCPVRCTPTPIEHTRGPYVKGQIWAEPDVADAAAWMRRVHGDRAFAATIGAAGRAAIETQFSPAAVGARYRRRLESIATF